MALETKMQPEISSDDRVDRSPGMINKTQHFCLAWLVYRPDHKKLSDPENVN